MRFKRVDAEAFGPLTSAALEFSDGLNVVWGPNEAAKSSWHGAMYAALCGRRRGRGASVRDEGFRKRHQPWDGDAWAVGAVIELDDGRSIRLAHDLANKRSDVIDAQLGRPVADDIVHDGGPDGALWLGLDRTTFLATACVRQADIAAVVDDPDGIRDLMQKAASTLGGEVTAAQAIDSLTSFRREAVGLDRTNAVKPLRKAVEAVAEAEAHLDAVRVAHDDYLRLLAEADSAAARVEVCRADLAWARRLVRYEQAKRVVADAAAVSRLAERLGDAEISGPAIDDDRLDALNTLVARWRSAEWPSAFEGPSLESIIAEIESIPPEPSGPTEPAPQVLAAAQALHQARNSLAALPEVPPVVGPQVELLEEAERRAVLVRSPEPTDGGARAALDAARLALADRRRHESRRRMVLGFSALGAIGGVAAAGLGYSVIGLAAVVAAIALAVVVFGLGGGSEGHDVEALEADVAAFEQRLEAHRREALLAAEWLSKRGFVADPVGIRHQAFARSAADSERERWAQRVSELRHAEQEAIDELRSALIDEGISVVDIDDSLSRYLDVVNTNSQIMKARERLGLLVEQRRERQREQQVLHRFESLVDEVRRAVLEFRPQFRSDTAQGWGAELIDMVDQLRAAQRDRSELAGVRARLEVLLQGRSVADVEAAATEAREVLNQLDMGSNGGAVDRIDLDELGRRLTDAEKTHSELGGRLRSIDGASVDVAGAEASVAEARRELQRVRTLADVLDYTVEHLAKAESEAFRRVAPLVAESVTEHIAKVTNGRYVEALVDPEALEVTVRDASGRYRPAGALSHGTTEQIFLLLRLAMVKVLTKPGETCPVLVDDATVHADDSRTEALLSLLHDASAERQIVVFTQETAVLDWARRNLGPRDKVIELLAAS